MLLYYKMKIITDKTIQQNVMQYGFNHCDKEVYDRVNESFICYMNNILHKSQKYIQNDKLDMDAIVKGLRLQKDQKHQRGGAETTMPLEYYGVDSGHYYDNPEGGIDMSVTNDYIRPSMHVNDPAGVIESYELVGGNRVRFCLPKSASSKLSGLYENVKIQTKAREFMVKKFENDFSELMSKVKKVSGKDRYLHTEVIDKILSQRKYSKLFKE